MSATPRTVRADRIHTIPRDNVSVGDYWLIVDFDHVVMHQQKEGEESTQRFKVPKAVFNCFVDFYNTGKMRQVPK